ncbi:hypothetical protein [Bacillus safensis]|uniref:DUF3847 domain-containing protein n=1 Tax=Bacillus safensis TaxID=561879 RepID=A0A1L6ZPF0_BACIA|nr:hypothetical protein [Bacillus safensis]APT48382.1 hypothetical protein BSA145_21200 [Bacillus safensis]
MNDNLHKHWNELRKISQEKEKLLSELNKEKNKDKKKRNHMLIRKGLLLDQYFETHDLSLDEIQLLLKSVSLFVLEKKKTLLKKEEQNG